MLYFKDLSLNEIKQLQEHKVSNLGFVKSLTSLDRGAQKCGKSVVQIDRFERTTQKCSACGIRSDMN